MQRTFPESDWKILSRLKPLALDRLCQRILAEAGGIVNSAEQNERHRAYLELFRYIQTSDKAIGDCFNNWRRSQAFLILANWRARDLLTDEEFNTFSAETRALVGVLRGE